MTPQFFNPSVFQPCKNGTATIIGHLQPELHAYRWAFQWSRGLPHARILPKGSKNLTKARPIIAYTRSWRTKVSSFLAAALRSIMQTPFPAGSTFNINSVSQRITTRVEAFAAYGPSRKAQVMIQQGLIGFCNSVPRSRVCSALHFFCCNQRAKNCRKVESPCWPLESDEKCLTPP